ncbi:S58 family peptidase [Oceanobacillus piezotolerans]|uniref:S58 family peptidase n=1 Tax=Oceanobacillus piezotolerans TaxID=2448030 RepID=A0A498D5Z0_9BACI|nr:P1 family peptidase [Oceanobacillus piezotolerans]RLL40386.1 S58 family peptidase [Oceanobacillus piezotolerans]
MPLPKGQANCITDIEGVQVGHVTLYEKMDQENTICTGVTAILPHKGNLFKDKVHAGVAIINGYGKSAGLIQIDELGLVESPIMLTNTLSIGPVLQGTLTYMLEENQDIGDNTSTINIVVGECNDGYLNSTRLQAVKPEHAIEAIQVASDEPAQEGAVGAGKGTICFGYKGGIGTSSRVITAGGETYKVGVLVQSNFGNRDEALFADFKKKELDTPDGSIMIIIATDAPLYGRQLKRLAKRAAAGLGRTGSHIAHGSGDIAIAFSTANKHRHYADTVLESLTYIRDGHPIMNDLFLGVVEATEEAVIRSLQMAETTEGRQGRKVERAPLS